MTQSGRIADNKGYGFDGTIYARMMVDSLRDGGDNARMRPLVLLTNQLAYDFIVKEPIRTFQALNLVYTALLALVLCGILDLYGASTAHKLDLSNECVRHGRDCEDVRVLPDPHRSGRLLLDRARHVHDRPRPSAAHRRVHNPSRFSRASSAW